MVAKLSWNHPIVHGSCFPPNALLNISSCILSTTLKQWHVVLVVFAIFALAIYISAKKQWSIFILLIFISFFVEWNLIGAFVYVMYVKNGYIYTGNDAKIHSRLKLPN